MIWGKKKKTLQLGFGFFVGKVETIKESEWTACRGCLERRWSPGLCGQDPGRTLPAPGRPRSHWSCFTGTRRGQALGPAPREGKSDMVPPAVRWGRHSHKPPRHSGAHALGTPGEERERPAAALGLKSKTTRLDCEPVPDRPAQPRPGAGHRAGRERQMPPAAAACVSKQPPKQRRGTGAPSAPFHRTRRDAEAGGGELTCPGSDDAAAGHPVLPGVWGSEPAHRPRTPACRGGSDGPSAREDLRFSIKNVAGSPL